MIETAPEIWDNVFKDVDPSLIAETWNENPFWLLYKRSLDPIKEKLYGKDAVEFGSGTGRNSLGLALEYGMRVTLVDFSDVALKISRALFETVGVKDVEYVKGDILDFDWHDYELSHSEGVVEHYSPQNRKKIIRKHVEPLIIGGYSLIIAPNRLNFLYLLSKYVAEKLGKWEYGYENAVTAKILSKEMMDSRLRLIASDGDGLITPAYGMVSLSEPIKTLVREKLRPYKGRIENVRVKKYIKRLLPFIGEEVAILGKKL